MSPPLSSRTARRDPGAAVAIGRVLCDRPSLSQQSVLIEDSRILAAGSDKAARSGRAKSEEQLGFREETEQLCTTCSVQQAVLHYMFMVACCLHYMFMSACSSAPHEHVCICISALCLSLCTFGRAHSLSPFGRGGGETPGAFAFGRPLALSS